MCNNNAAIVAWNCKNSDLADVRFLPALSSFRRSRIHDTGKEFRGSIRDFQSCVSVTAHPANRILKKLSHQSRGDAD